MLNEQLDTRPDSVMRPRSSSRGAQYKCLSYSYSYQLCLVSFWTVVEKLPLVASLLIVYD